MYIFICSFPRHRVVSHLQSKTKNSKVKRGKKPKKDKKRSKRRENKEVEMISHNREEYEEANGTVTEEPEQKTYSQPHFRLLAQDTVLRMVGYGIFY